MEDMQTQESNGNKNVDYEMRIANDSIEWPVCGNEFRPEGCWALWKDSGFVDVDELAALSLESKGLEVELLVAEEQFGS